MLLIKILNQFLPQDTLQHTLCQFAGSVPFSSSSQATAKNELPASPGSGVATPRLVNGVSGKD